MKKKPKERDWMLESGFELRYLGSALWAVHEGGIRITEPATMEKCRELAKELRKSRNEQA